MIDEVHYGLELVSYLLMYISLLPSLPIAYGAGQQANEGDTRPGQGGHVATASSLLQDPDRLPRMPPRQKIHLVCVGAVRSKRSTSCSELLAVQRRPHRCQPLYPPLSLVRLLNRQYAIGKYGNSVITLNR